MQQDDAQRTVCDPAQTVGDRLHLCRRLGVHAAQQRLAEVRKRGARKAADEAFRPRDADGRPPDVVLGALAIEHVHAHVAQHGRDLVAPRLVQIVVSEDRADRDRRAAARIGKHRRLLGFAVRRQVAREQDDVRLFLYTRE